MGADLVTTIEQCAQFQLFVGANAGVVAYKERSLRAKRFEYWHRVIPIFDRAVIESQCDSAPSFVGV
jgi:hypothetical protein